MQKTPWLVPTLKERADLPPAGDASLAGELAHGGLQEEHGDATAHKEDDVRNEEGTFTFPQHNGVSTIDFKPEIWTSPIYLISIRTKHDFTCLPYLSE